MRQIFVAVANPVYESNSHTKSGWISFNGKGEDSKTGCDDARKHLEIFLFFEKSYLLTAGLIKAAYSVTMNFFRKKLFSF